MKFSYQAEDGNEQIVDKPWHDRFVLKNCIPHGFFADGITILDHALDDVRVG